MDIYKDQFIFDFKSYLKVCQPKAIFIYSLIIVGFSLLAVGEFIFYNKFNTMQVVGCSLPTIKNITISSNISFKQQQQQQQQQQQVENTFTLDNCFKDYYNGLTVPICINNKYNTNSNYSLSFDLPFFGDKNDKFSKAILSIAIVVFLTIQIIYQSCQYFEYKKRIRIQNILASRCQVYINDDLKKYEKRLTVFFVLATIFYILIKMYWVVYRNNQYQFINCEISGSELFINFKLQFNETLISSLPSILFGSFPLLIIFPLVYFGNWRNYLSNLDFKNLISNFSSETIVEIKNIKIINIKKYNEIVRNEITKKYKNQSSSSSSSLSFISLFLRRNTFSFSTTPTNEIIEILSNTNQNHFESIESFKISKISFINNDQESFLNQLIN
ncbi:hypothetical protein RB653_005478 [Dictyostelium firmibasis]|uniref:Transmembrane protein n=1 Tax=Dictyostelium firmibasis TaxID=79012 RepID=A0AAN7U1A9_9MYCE